MAKCKYCHQDITWFREGRRNIPLENDGGIHDCEAKKEALSGHKKLDLKSLSPEEIKKYETAINQKAQKDSQRKRP